ncbi:MAG: universal stress protein [Ginsengibacter sp.]
MKKILLLINDYHLPQSALGLAIKIALHEEATIFGIFIQSNKYTNEESYLFPGDINLTDKDFTGVSDKEEHLQFLKASISSFSDTCTAANVACKTHTVDSNFLDTLIDHSAFADLIVCDADTPPLNYSMNTLLAHAHCPVLMVNKDYLQTDCLVFTYDDRSSSIHAVKWFTYLFGIYKQLPVHFVSVVPHNVLGIEYEELIKEWLPLHYPDTTMEVLKGETRDELTKFINKLSNPLVIMGAFGRNSLSRFFKESLASIIVEQTNVPLFVAHD